MYSSKNHNIKSRNNANDVFITPLELAKKQIQMINVEASELWLDPFRNSGHYYNQFPTDNKDWCEILENKDFFEYQQLVNVICSNPPYSLMDKVLQHSVSLHPRVISYLIGINNLTAKRIEFMNQAGYGLTRIHLCKVFKWFGMSAIVQFEFQKENIISFDRVVWRND